MDSADSATLLLSFALGIKHATDADHIVAVSTLLAGTRGARRGAALGACWGAGHLLTVLAAGGALVALRLRVPPGVEWGLELAVALVLVALGLRTIHHGLTGRYHFHEHQHGGHIHAHLHFHPGCAPGHEHASHNPLRHAAKPLALGMLHGLAGTAGLTLLVLSSIPSRPFGLLYLLVFGLGALAGMAAFSALLSWPLERASGHLRGLHSIRLAAGTASAVFGAFLTHRALVSLAWPF